MKTSRCECCGIEFSRVGRKALRFCSIDCKAKWQRTQKPVDETWLRQKYLVEGLSTYDIGRMVGRDQKSVYRWLVGYGIPTRPRGENLKGDDCYMLRPNPVPTFLGKKHSEETRRKLSEKASVKKPYLRGSANGMYGKTGSQNPRYVDGSSPERQSLYARAEWKSIVRAVYARDNYRCVRCGSPHTGNRSLNAHHVKPWAGHPELRFSIDNLVTLCKPCHVWVHSKANTDKEYLA